MAAEKKRQFSLSILVRIFIGVLVVVSIGVLLRSLMYVNELRREAEDLRAAIIDLRETRAELEELLGSAEEVDRLLSDRETCLEVLQSGTAAAELLEAYEQAMKEIDLLLRSSQNRKYIERIARSELDLYYAEEEIYYNDINQ